MAFAFVDVFDAAVQASATTLPVTKTFAAGDSCEMCVTWTSSGGTSVTVADNNGNTWTAVGAARFEGNGPTAFQLFHAKNINAGSTTITATYNAARTNRGICGLRYTGIDTAAAAQISASNEQVPGVTTTDGITTGTMTPTGQPALLVGFVFDTSYGAATYTAGTGFTSRGAFASWAAAFGLNGNTEEKRLTATSAVAATWTSSNVDRATSLGMVLTEAAAAAAFNSGWAQGANKIIGVGVHA